MKTSWWSVGCLAGTALSGTVLILLIPSLFSADDGPLGIVVVMGFLTLALGAGARLSMSR